jgi:hypothetical protein
MNSEGEKIDIQMSNIIVNIAPAAVRILIAVANSFGKHQVDINCLLLLLFENLLCIFFSQILKKRNLIFKQYSIINL